MTFRMNPSCHVIVTVRSCRLNETHITPHRGGCDVSYTGVDINVIYLENNI